MIRRSVVQQARHWSAVPFTPCPLPNRHQHHYPGHSLTEWETLREYTTLLSKVVHAARAARYMGLVGPELIEDHRNPDPYLQAVAGEWRKPVVNLMKAAIPSDGLALPDFPDAPSLSASVSPSWYRQPYYLVLACEKSTMDSILCPLADYYRADLFTAKGYQSLSHAETLLQRAKQLGKPCRVLFMTDFDPAGQSMPVSFARHLEKLRLERYPEVDVHVYPLILTKEQVDAYQIERMPIESKEEGAYRGRVLKFEEMHGAGGAELDALEEQYPGELARVVGGFIEGHFYDPSLTLRTEQANQHFEMARRQAVTDVWKKYGARWSALQAEYHALREEFRSRMEDISARMTSTAHLIEHELAMEAPRPFAYATPEVQLRAPDTEPLFDSSRDYLEQMEYYKRYQGKDAHTPQKKRGRPRKTVTHGQPCQKRGRGRPRKTTNNSTEK